MLTLEELQILMPVIDAGIKAAGLAVFQNDGGVKMQSALAKLQQMAEEAGREASSQTAREGVPDPGI